MAHLKFYIDKNGYPPSFREIAEATGLKSTGAVHRVLHQMQAVGLVEFQPGIPRTLRIIADDAERSESADI